ncbi:MAG: LPXTG cell wall anchor domain-containing protein [Mogibacterium sp.]|nr:LPXTG cell wall anchor domain-containing protein [Mogibacterium sp.]
MDRYHDEIDKNQTVSSDGSGEASIYKMTISKVDGYDASKKLAGVKFLLTCDSESALPEPKVLTTDANGLIVLDGDPDSEDYKGFNLYGGVQYHLTEIEEPDNYMKVGFDYLFTFEDDINNVDYDTYHYFATDSMQIKNWPYEGLILEKQVVSSDPDDIAKKYKFKVTLSGEDVEGASYEGDIVHGNEVNGTYGDAKFTNGVAEVELKSGQQLSIYGLPVPAGTKFTVEELNADDFDTSISVSTTGEESEQEFTGNVFEGTISHDGYTKTVFTNTKEEQKGSLKLKKTSDLTGDEAATKVYKIAVKNSDGKYMNQDGTTSDSVVWIDFHADDEKIWSELPPGVYTIEEDENSAAVTDKSWTWSVSGGEGVTVVDKNVTVTGGDTATEATVNNSYTDKVKISVKKEWEPVPDEGSVTVELRRYAKLTKGTINLTLTSQNGGAIEGAVFELYKDGAATGTTYTTDVNGKISVTNLEVGSYYLKQNSTPEGYSMEGHQIQTDTLTVEKVTTPQVLDASMTNTALVTAGTVTLTLTDSSGNPLPGGTFTLYKDGQILSRGLTTNEQGQIIVENLAAGNYYFAETAAPEGYKLPSNAQTRAFDVQDLPGQEQTFEYSMTNQRMAKGSVTITLTSAVDGSKVDGATFELYKNGTKVNEGTTDSNGSVSFEDLGAGTYRVKQTTTRTGLKVAEDQTFKVEDNEATDQHTDLSFTNAKESKIYTLRFQSSSDNKSVEYKYEEGTTVTFIFDNGNQYYNPYDGIVLSGDVNGKIGTNDDGYSFTVNMDGNKTITLTETGDSNWGNVVTQSLQLSPDPISDASLNTASRSSLKQRVVSFVKNRLLGNAKSATQNDASPAEAPEGYAEDSEFTPISYTMTGGNWEYTFPSQEKYDADGNEYYYYVVETAHSPEDYWIDSYSGGPYNADGTVTIVNKKETEGSVKVTKAFSGVNSLPSTFKITASYVNKDGTTQTIELTTSSTGMSGTGTEADPYTWTLTGIPLGTTVTFVESGYNVDGYNVTVTGSATTTDKTTATAVAAEDPGVASFVNTYDEQKVTLDIIKLEKNGTKKLPGAEFTLNKIDPDNSTVTFIPDTEQVVTTDDQGEASFANLTKGYYQIEETKQPDGYILTEDSKMYIEVTGTTVKLLTKGSGAPKTWTESTEVYGIIKTFENNTLTLENDYGTELPMTGGIGTTIFYILGSILVIGGGIYFISRRRAMK